MMGRDVALKIIAPEIVSNERAVARFRREMRLVGRLDHPNVVRAFDADQVNNVLFIVMEYVQGVSLGQRLKDGPLPAAEVVNYAAQAALGLAHAHEQGVVHRDVKPSNLLVNEDRQVKVLDLGLGVLMEADNSATFATADNIAVGTVDYMSPEQALGKDVDGRSDLYSLGCAMYHLITGKLAFPGDSPIERLGKRINGRPIPIQQLRKDVPSSLAAVLEKLMAHSPADRYQTATEASEALSALVKRPKKAIEASSVVASPLKPTAPKSNMISINTEPPRIVHVRPDYPGWFRPLARLAEKKPKLALVACLGFVLAGLGLGFIAGKML
jgi:serine/threonine protein kinase